MLVAAISDSEKQWNKRCNFEAWKQFWIFPNNSDPKCRVSLQTNAFVVPEGKRYLKRVEMKTTIINVTTYFTYIFLDRHYTMRTDVLHKVDNYSSHVSRRDWNTFPGFTAKLSQGRGMDHMELGSRKQFWQPRPLGKCLDRPEGQPTALACDGEGTGVGAEPRAGSTASGRGLRGAGRQQINVGDVTAPKM